MKYVYCCEKCKAIGDSYYSHCPKCSWGKLLEVPFDGSFVVVQDPELRAKLKKAYEKVGEKSMSF